mmetsp:Transcript_22230/g.54866  ORF Transcript_22230/g.54866 Transcript_22230/m.54866 type:complete len:212 (+) Transcript_22230:552-1187(+)
MLHRAPGGAVDALRPRRRRSSRGDVLRRRTRQGRADQRCDRGAHVSESQLPVPVQRGDGPGGAGGAVVPKPGDEQDTGTSHGCVRRSGQAHGGNTRHQLGARGVHGEVRGDLRGDARRAGPHARRGHRAGHRGPAACRRARRPRVAVGCWRGRGHVGAAASARRQRRRCGSRRRDPGLVGTCCRRRRRGGAVARGRCAGVRPAQSAHRAIH